MIELTSIGFEHKERCDAAVFAENSPSADFCFGNLFIWQNAFCTRSGFIGQRMISRHCLGSKSAYAFPVGSGDLMAQEADAVFLRPRELGGKGLAVFGTGQSPVRS